MSAIESNLENALNDLITCSIHYFLKKETAIEEITQLQKVDEMMRLNHLKQILENVPAELYQKFQLILGLIIHQLMYLSDYRKQSSQESKLP